MEERFEVVIVRKCKECLGSGLRLRSDGTAERPSRNCRGCGGYGQYNDHIGLEELKELLVDHVK